MTEGQTNEREESLVAISAVFHQDRRYREFYDTNADRLSGFPGIWRYVMEAGRAFNVVEQEVDIADDWIQAVENFVAELYAHVSPADADGLLALARRAIARARAGTAAA